MVALRSITFRGAVVLALGLMSSSAVAQSARLVLEKVNPTSSTISVGQTITIELFAENVYDSGAPTPDEVAAYQNILEIVPLSGSTGTIQLDDPPADNIFVDTNRPDWLFASANGPIAVSVAAELKVAGLVFFPPFARVTTRVYLGTYVFAPSSNALGDFQIRFKPIDPQEPSIVPNQLINQNSSLIPYTEVPAGGIVISVVDIAPNDSCINAEALSDGVTSFSTDNATTDGPSHPGSGCDQGGSTTIENDIWYDYTASCSGILAVSTCGTANFDTRVAVYDDCACPVSDVNLLTCNDDAGGCGLTSEAVVSSVSEGTCYKVRVGGTGNVSGTGSVTVTCIANDLCPDADPLSLGTSVPGSTRGTPTNDATGLNCGQGLVDSPGVWYAVTGTGDRLRASIANASYDTRLTVYQGSCGSLTCVGDADNLGGTQESVTWCSSPGVVYRILVHGRLGQSGNFTLGAASASCNDGNACTDDSCSAGVCANVPNYNQSVFCCNPSTGGLVAINDQNPCTVDTCSPGTGNVSHTPVANGPNAGCDDQLICTIDECQSGVCNNIDINTISCQDDLDCPEFSICGDGTGDTQPGRCFCDSGPTLELMPQPGLFAVEGCYGAGEIVEVRVEMGVSEEGIVGAQFFLEYDADTLDFLTIQPGVAADPTSPFSLEFNETIDEFNGTIDYLVGLTFGATPTLGPETVAVIRFETLAECDAFVRFRPTGPGGQGNLLTGAGGVEVDPILLDSPAINIDVNPPVLSACPADIVVTPDAGQLTAVVTWPLPLASDGCDAGPASVVCEPPSGSVFPAGTTVVTCTATDSCGLTDSSCLFDVTVEPAVFRVDIQLSSTVDSGPFQRCLVFDLWDCDGPPNAQHITVSRNVTFSNGMASGVNVSIPGGAWECASVRDPLHTLRSTSTDFSTADGINYTASFMGPRNQGGHWLVGGNLNGDDFIDILDFGVLFPLHLSLANSDTACGSIGPDGNINGDNLVDLLDLVIFVGNSLKGSEPTCCSAVASASASGPIMSISVEQLEAMGLSEMTAADVNRDGMLDMEDVRLVLQGYVPPPDDDGARRVVPKEKKGRRRVGSR